MTEKPTFLCSPPASPPTTTTGPSSSMPSLLETPPARRQTHQVRSSKRLRLSHGTWPDYENRVDDGYECDDEATDGEDCPRILCWSQTDGNGIKLEPTNPGALAEPAHPRKLHRGNNLSASSSSSASENNAEAENWCVSDDQVEQESPRTESTEDREDRCTPTRLTALAPLSTSRNPPTVIATITPIRADPSHLVVPPQNLNPPPVVRRRRTVSVDVQLPFPLFNSFAEIQGAIDTNAGPHTTAVEPQCQQLQHEQRQQHHHHEDHIVNAVPVVRLESHFQEPGNSVNSVHIHVTSSAASTQDIAAPLKPIQQPSQHRSRSSSSSVDATFHAAPTARSSAPSNASSWFFQPRHHRPQDQAQPHHGDPRLRGAHDRDMIGSTMGQTRMALNPIHNQHQHHGHPTHLNRIQSSQPIQTSGVSAGCGHCRNCIQLQQPTRAFVQHTQQQRQHFPPSSQQHGVATANRPMRKDGVRQPQQQPRYETVVVQSFVTGSFVHSRQPQHPQTG
ncbi:hypothetical protein HK102_013992, partial [Quaeritorhiza haematococci]